MKHLFYACLILNLLGIGGAMAQEKTFSWDPLVIEKLDNGITVIVKEDRARPLAVTDVWFKVGSRNEVERTNGIAHFLEHTLFKGTKKRGIGEIARDIEAMGGRTNAATSLDFTHYYIECEADKIMQALEIHADVFRNSLLDPKAIDDERGVIIEEIKRGEDTPGSVLWNTLTANVFSSHPYRRPIIGPRENIASGGITRDDMHEFFTTWYNTGNMY
ncbi:MAG TPA: pitrilysin family protein, partial [Candidatus Ozemobacteraceae bacterium]|nr:pitrilysin family protein [Candidatus Ozemobacteraceae bacterium]